MSETDVKEFPEDVLKTARETVAALVSADVRWQYISGKHDHFAVILAVCTAILAERERIASALEDEADMSPCMEDANVTRSNAMLIRANFSYEDAEKLSEQAEKSSGETDTKEQKPAFDAWWEKKPDGSV